MTVGMPVSTRWPRQPEGCFPPDLQEACGALEGARNVNLLIRK